MGFNRSRIRVSLSRRFFEGQAELSLCATVSSSSLTLALTLSFVRSKRKLPYYPKTPKKAQSLERREMRKKKKLFEPWVACK